MPVLATHPPKQCNEAEKVTFLKERANWLDGFRFRGTGEVTTPESWVSRVYSLPLAIRRLHQPPGPQLFYLEPHYPAQFESLYVLLLDVPLKHCGAAPCFGKGPLSGIRCRFIDSIFGK